MHVLRQVDHIIDVGDIGAVLLEEVHFRRENQLSGHHHFGLVRIEVRVRPEEIGNLRLGRYAGDIHVGHLVSHDTEILADIVRVLYEPHLLVEIQTRERAVLAFAHEHDAVASDRHARQGDDSPEVQLLHGALA